MKDDQTDPRLREQLSDVTLIAEDAVVEQAQSVHASLVVISGWEIGREIEVHGLAQILGRSNLANTYVASPSVSRQHLRIDLVREGGREHFAVTDLGSSNGTYVNGERVETAPLGNGDKLRMGDVVFKFVVQDEVEAQFHKEVHQLIHFDQLTGLLKMEAFRRRLDAMLSRTEPCPPFVLSMTDLDGLKRVNDTHGHLAGRMVVREMGAMMRAAVRPEDIAGLYGGDEAIILYRDAELDAATEVAEGLRKMIEERVFDHGGATFGVTISQGLAQWPADGRTAEELIAAADRALYAAKQRGRNRIETTRTL